MKHPPSLAKQVEKIQNDRTYLRSMIATIIAVSKTVKGAIRPSLVEQLQRALDTTANEGEDA